MSRLDLNWLHDHQISTETISFLLNNCLIGFELKKLWMVSGDYRRIFRGLKQIERVAKKNTSFNKETNKIETTVNSYSCDFVYDTFGQLIRTESFLGKQLFFYDDEQRLTKIVDPFKREHRFIYKNDLLIEEINEIKNEEITFRYDKHKRITEKIFNNSFSWQWFYPKDDPWNICCDNYRIHKFDHLGQSFTEFYSQKKLVQTINHLGFSSFFIYDNRDNLVEERSYGVTTMWKFCFTFGRLSEIYENQKLILQFPNKIFYGL